MQTAMLQLCQPRATQVARPARTVSQAALPTRRRTVAVCQAKQVSNFIVGFAAGYSAVTVLQTHLPELAGALIARQEAFAAHHVTMMCYSMPAPAEDCCVACSLPRMLPQLQPQLCCWPSAVSDVLWCALLSRDLTPLCIDSHPTAGPAIAAPVFDVADVTGTEQSSR